MREKTVERKLVQKVRERGGLALKLVCPGFNGVLDRLLLFPGRANLPERKDRNERDDPFRSFFCVPISGIVIIFPGDHHAGNCKKKRPFFLSHL